MVTDDTTFTTEEINTIREALYRSPIFNPPVTGGIMRKIRTILTRGDACKLPEVTLNQLAPGDVIVHESAPGATYIVTKNDGHQALAVRIVDVVNPSEWRLAAQARYRYVER